MAAKCPRLADLPASPASLPSTAHLAPLGPASTLVLSLAAGPFALCQFPALERSRGQRTD